MARTITFSRFLVSLTTKSNVDSLTDCKNLLIYVSVEEEPSHLNGSKLHVNKRGTEILSKTFIESISNTVHWQSTLHSPDNCLIDEYNANLSSKENLSIIRKRNIG